MNLKKERKLTAKQKAFAEAFVKTNNASEAVRIAKYDVVGKPANLTGAIGAENLTKPHRGFYWSLWFG